MLEQNRITVLSVILANRRSVRRVKEAVWQFQIREALLGRYAPLVNFNPEPARERAGALKNET